MQCQTASGNLGVTALHSLQQGVMEKDVLVLRLHNVVTLGPQASDMPVYIDGLLVLDAFQHGVDHDERPSPTDSSAAGKQHQLCGCVGGERMLCLFQ